MSDKMRELLSGAFIQQYLHDCQLVVCPPMPQNGFNEWNYWHVIDKKTGGLYPTSFEALLRDAEEHEQKKEHLPNKHTT